ncbi:E3 ubiquitin-protein ligase KEG [Glycine soja]
MKVRLYVDQVVDPCRPALLKHPLMYMEYTVLSPHYTAPEAWGQLLKKSLNLFWDDAIGILAESDAWSFGCTLVEMGTGFVSWAGLSSEEIYQAVVKTKKLLPHYASVVGGGIPSDLWRMIGECLQFKPSNRPSFTAMLTIFLLHLQGIPRSLPASPDNDFVKSFSSNVIELFPFLSKTPSIFIIVCLGDVRSVSDLLFKATSDYGSNGLSSLLEAQNADEQTALHLACRCGSAELVEAILEYEEANVDVLDKDGDPPLVYALAAGSPECVRSLIKRGANVRPQLRDGFSLAWSSQLIAFLLNFDSIEKLSNLLVDIILLMPNFSSKERLQRGERIGANFACCGADPYAQHSQHGWTALRTAVMTDDVELVKVILAAGVDVNIRNVHNGIPLHIALARGAKSCVELLLCTGADCNLQDGDGNTALHIAARTAKMICENLDWLIVCLGILMLIGKTLGDILDVLPREWISEDLMEALMKKGVCLSPAIFEVGDWVKFRKTSMTPTNGWEGDRQNVLANEVVKVIPLDKGQHVQLKEDIICVSPTCIAGSLYFPDSDHEL